MPRLSPSASRSAWPSASAQSSTVWCSSTRRSPVQVSSQREAAVAGHLLQHVVEEADARGDRHGRLAVQVDRDAIRRSPSCAARSARRAPAGTGARRSAGQVSPSVAVDADAADAEVPRRARGRSGGRRSRSCARGRLRVRAMNSVSRPVLGLRQAQSSAGKCGQKNSASNSMPCEAKSSRRKSCGSRKLGSGNDAVPSPSWLLTSTKR